jgi:hypothetical protein
MKKLKIFVKVPKKLIDYQKKLQSDLKSKFSIDSKLQTYLILLEVPVEQVLGVGLKILLNKELDRKSNIKVRIVSPQTVEYNSKTNPKIYLSLSEKSWNKVVDLQTNLLPKIQSYIDKTKKIITKPKTYYNSTPKKYLKEYSSDNVLRWYEGGILVAEIHDYKRRKDVLGFIIENYQIDLGFESKLEFKIHSAD